MKLLYIFFLSGHAGSLKKLGPYIGSNRLLCTCMSFAAFLPNDTMLPYSTVDFFSDFYHMSMLDKNRKMHG